MTPVLTLDDERQMRDLLHRYCRGVDRIDGDLMRSCYWPDATDDRGSVSGSADDLVAQMVRLMPRHAISTHRITNIMYDAHDTDPNRARTECYVLADHQTRGGPRYTNTTVSVRFIDVWERRGDEWRVIHRQAVSDWVRHHGDETIVDVDERFPRGDRGDRTDLIYQPWQ